MSIKSNRLLLLVTLCSYLLIIFSNDKWDLPMILALPLSCLGIYDFYTFLVPASGFTGFGILIYFLVRQKPFSVHHNTLLITGLFLMWVPVIASKSSASIKIQWAHGFYLFIPEVIFFICSSFLVTRMFEKENSSY